MITALGVKSNISIKERKMNYFVFILIILNLILLIICYALLIIAHDADEREKKMHKKLKENENYINNKL